MVDAEQSYMQPVMDALTIQLQQQFNRSVPVIFNTYQCYLKSTEHRWAAVKDDTYAAVITRTSADGKGHMILEQAWITLHKPRASCDHALSAWHACGPVLITHTDIMLIAQWQEG